MTSEIVFFNVPHLSLQRGGEIWESQVIQYLNSTGLFKAKLITTDCCYKRQVVPNFEYKIVPQKTNIPHLFDYNYIRNDMESADVVYYFYGAIGSQIPIIKNIKNIKKIIFGYHAANDIFLIQKIYYNLLEYKIKNIGYHHALTRYQYEILIRKGFKKVFWVPNFVDVDEFKSIDKDPSLIVAPGAVTKEKGIDTIIRIAKLKNSINIYITGDEPSKKLPDNVKYVGKLNREEYKKLVTKSSICILPTHGETFSMTMLECLAAGNLVLARDLPVLREVAGSTPSVDFAKNDREFISKLENFINILKKPHEFSELSTRSIERVKIFNKWTILEKFKNELLLIMNEKY